MLMLVTLSSIDKPRIVNLAGGAETGAISSFLGFVHPVSLLVLMLLLTAAASFVAKPRILCRGGAVSSLGFYAVHPMLSTRSCC